MRRWCRWVKRKSTRSSRTVSNSFRGIYNRFSFSLWLRRSRGSYCFKCLESRLQLLTDPGRSYSDYEQISSVTLEPHITAYTWKILVFFPGRPTIGNTFTVVIPIVSIGSLTMRISEKNGRTTVLEPAGHYHLFHKECTLDIEGDGRLAALVIVPDGY